MNSVVPGCELTKEPFRWDQRIFGLVLEIPATPPVDNGFVYIPVAESHPINAMCDVTGGEYNNFTVQLITIVLFIVHQSHT